MDPHFAVDLLPRNFALGPYEKKTWTVTYSMDLELSMYTFLFVGPPILPA